MAEEIKSVVMFDLDGCVSDDSWRQHLMPADPKQQSDWDAYHEHCDRDDVLEQGAIVLKSHIDQGQIILFTTARPSSVGDKTAAWIEKNFGITPQRNFSILMRQEGDTRHAIDLKRDYAKFIIQNSKSNGSPIVAAYDDRLDIVNAYREMGLNACVLNKDGIQIWNPPEGAPAMAPNNVQPPSGSDGRKTVPDLLHDAANVFVDRNGVYKDGYKRAGDVYAALFPEGIVLRSSKDFNRFTLVMMIVAKLTRYSFNFANGGHLDSLDDMAVYAMMLKELDLP